MIEQLVVTLAVGWLIIGICKLFLIIAEHFVDKE